MLFLEPAVAGPLPAADGPGEAQAPPAGWSLEGACPSAWRTREISASGVIGDPSSASEELGRQLFGRLVESWERRLEALLRSDWPPTSGRA